ncbi:phenoloxidase-activating factor 2-like [Planococcus citri]|uniref:phenoloxidase-activating factor 2-like n=1 Tax=Planococcus citri TaxID=170843 RepID=UPI0031F9C36B
MRNFCDLFTLVSVFLLITTSSLSLRIVRSPAEGSSEASPVSNTGSEKCGIRKRTDNIIPDVDPYAQFGEFPWIVAILQTSPAKANGEQTLGFICSGSLLSPSVVLTAAHCVNNVDPSTLRIRAGVYDMNGDTNDTLPHQERSVKKISIHGNYSHKLLLNDLALLNMTEPFHFADHIGRICAPLGLTPSPDSYDSTKCIVAGWGKNRQADEGTVPQKLKKVYVVTVPNDECQNSLRSTRLGGKFLLHPSFMCAREEDPYNMVCQGDGGGPLVCSLKSSPEIYVQVGVTSWGVGCSSAIPGIYAALITNTEWLNNEFNNLSGTTTSS